MLEAILAALEQKQRKRHMDDASKAGLRCIMRAFVWERRGSTSAACLWEESYSQVRLQESFVQAAWLLLEDILCRADGIIPVHHAEEVVKLTRSSLGGPSGFPSTRVIST